MGELDLHMMRREGGGSAHKQRKVAAAGCTAHDKVTSISCWVGQDLHFVDRPEHELLAALPLQREALPQHHVSLKAVCRVTGVLTTKILN